MPSGKSSMRWLTEGSMHDGHVYVPTNLWVPVIGATDGSQLPTPRAAMGDARNSRPWIRPLDKPQNLENAIARTPISLLPTPVVNDMGAGKTVEKWDAWTAEQREKHRNGNGHGKSLSIEVQRLLPTPTARDYKDTGKNTNYQRQADKKLLAGVIMVQQSNDGDTSSDGQPPPQ
jgi:hypothetical protein